MTMTYCMSQVAKANTVAVVVVPDLTRILDHSVVAVPNQMRTLDHPVVNSSSTESFRRKNHSMTS
jgi:hypothetical protein